MITGAVCSRVHGDEDPFSNSGFHLRTISFRVVHDFFAANSAESRGTSGTKRITAFRNDAPILVRCIP